MKVTLYKLFANVDRWSKVLSPSRHGSRLFKVQRSRVSHLYFPLLHYLCLDTRGKKYQNIKDLEQKEKSFLLKRYICLKNPKWFFDLILSISDRRNASIMKSSIDIMIPDSNPQLQFSTKFSLSYNEVFGFFEPTFQSYLNFE